MAKILEGKTLSQIIRMEVKEKISAYCERGFSQPGLAVIKVGSDPASNIYVANKQRACEEVGILSYALFLSEQSTQKQLKNLIIELNHSPHIHGILLQLPLPAHLDSQSLLELIDPNKDVDGFHPVNMGKLAQRIPHLRACTPYGIKLLLDHYQLSLTGKHVVIVGASNIVGRPMALEALLDGATVTICHRFTENLAYFVSQADCLIVAIGKHNIIQTAWLKEGSIVIDVGIHYLENGKICGDIDFNSAQERVGWITPVPGGVGPMTVAVLIKNCWQCYEESLKENS